MPRPRRDRDGPIREGADLARFGLYGDEPANRVDDLREAMAMCVSRITARILKGADVQTVGRIVRNRARRECPIPIKGWPVFDSFGPFACLWSSSLKFERLPSVDCKI